MTSILNKILGRTDNSTPMPMPVGMTEFAVWSKRIISKTGPLADYDSMQYVLASHIMHLPGQSANVPDQYFIDSLRKAAASQVAAQVFQDIKVRQEAAKQAAEATPAAQLSPTTSEVTPAPESVTSNAQKAE